MKLILADGNHKIQMLMMIMNSSSSGPFYAARFQKKEPVVKKRNKVPITARMMTKMMY